MRESASFIVKFPIVYSFCTLHSRLSLAFTKIARLYLWLLELTNQSKGEFCLQSTHESCLVAALAGYCKSWLLEGLTFSYSDIWYSLDMTCAARAERFTKSLYTSHFWVSLQWMQKRSTQTLWQLQQWKGAPYHYFMIYAMESTRINASKTEQSYYKILTEWILAIEFSIERTITRLLSTNAFIPKWVDAVIYYAFRAGFPQLVLPRYCVWTMAVGEDFACGVLIDQISKH